MINFIQGIKTLSPLPIFLLAFGLLIAGCNDSAVTEIEFANQQSLDTPEAYLKAIAKAQTNLFTHASSAIREMDEKEFEKVMGNVEKVLQRSPVWEEYSKAEGDFLSSEEVFGRGAQSR